MARGLPWPVRDGQAWRVDVNEPDQKARYVFDHMSDAVIDQARRIQEPLVFIKVFAGERDVAPGFPPGWSFPHPGFFMRGQAPAAPLSMADGYSLSLHVVRPGVRRAQVMAPDGSPAASGMVSWEDDYAVYNLIKTAPAHQRRGLASAVMTALGEAAQDAAAQQHILMATLQGRLLYESMGWTCRSDYTTAVILPPEQMS